MEIKSVHTAKANEADFGMWLKAFHHYLCIRYYPFLLAIPKGISLFTSRSHRNAFQLWAGFAVFFVIHRSFCCSRALTVKFTLPTHHYPYDGKG